MKKLKISNLSNFKDLNSLNIGIDFMKAKNLPHASRIYFEANGERLNYINV